MKKAQRPSYNKDWRCGTALDIATKRVDFLDKTGTIVVQPVPMEKQEQHQHDFMKGVFVTRLRDRRQRGAWREATL
jgi:hypothetical protein